MGRGRKNSVSVWILVGLVIQEQKPLGMDHLYSQFIKLPVLEKTGITVLIEIDTQLSNIYKHIELWRKYKFPLPTPNFLIMSMLTSFLCFFFFFLFTNFE